MGRAYRNHEEDEKCVQNFLGKPERNTSRPGWVDNNGG
jgi:hypothetical protein